jgi:apolipoprotein D and lipocalin family protein
MTAQDKIVQASPARRGLAPRCRVSARMLLILLLTTLAGCSSVEPLKPVESVDLDRFMGDWYVIANIPTALEKSAHNAVETYEMNDDGTIATTFTFRDGSFDGKRKEYNPKGFVREGTNNAVWGMRFVWPIKADYRIVYLEEDYSITIIGRNKRDYVWLMAREPEIPEVKYEELLALIGEMGYDVSQVQKVPQQWPG